MGARCWAIFGLRGVRRSSADSLAREGRVNSITGKTIPVAAQSVPVHGDTAGAVEIAQPIRDAIQGCGDTVKPLPRIASGV